MTTTPPIQKQPAIVGGILLLLVVLFTVSFFGSHTILQVLGLTHANATVLFISRLVYWLCLLIICIYSIKIEKQPLLIWEEKNYKFGVYLIMVLAILLILFMGSGIIGVLLQVTKVNNKSVKMGEMIAILRGSFSLLIFTALTAGVVEELIFRGYLLPRLQIIFKKPFMAIILSSLLFGMVHIGYGTILQVIGPIFIGLVFAIYYSKYRNIKVLILCHFLWDFIALLAQVHGH